MDELEERLARAIREYVDIVNDEEDGPFLDNPHDVARAVLAEIDSMGLVIVPREPTREMLIGYIRHMGYDPDEPADTLDKQLVGVGVKAKWKAMVDAALASSLHGKD